MTRTSKFLIYRKDAVKISRMVNKYLEENGFEFRVKPNDVYRDNDDD